MRNLSNTDLNYMCVGKGVLWADNNRSQYQLRGNCTLFGKSRNANRYSLQRLADNVESFHGLKQSQSSTQRRNADHGLHTRSGKQSNFTFHLMQERRFHTIQRRSYYTNLIEQERLFRSMSRDDTWDILRQ